MSFMMLSHPESLFSLPNYHLQKTNFTMNTNAFEDFLMALLVITVALVLAASFIVYMVTNGATIVAIVAMVAVAVEFNAIMNICLVGFQDM